MGTENKEVLVQAEVTDCMTGEKSAVGCLLSLVETEKFGLLVTASAKGCFTGFESFGVDKRTIKNGFPNGWLACAGRKDEYDTLFIPPAEMKRALGQLNLSHLFT